jgi:hypothetical protein
MLIGDFILATRISKKGYPSPRTAKQFAQRECFALCVLRTTSA